MSEYYIRLAGRDDRDVVIEMVSLMFRHDVTERYEWLYARNPHGAAATWLACEQGTDEPVALTSLFPRKVMVDGVERVGSIGGDCYVLPKARRRGLATRLHKTCLSEMQDVGIEFMYGPPLPNNLGALIKAGAREVGTFRRYTRLLTADAVVRAFSGGREVPRFANRLLDLPLRLFDFATGVGRDECELTAIDQFGPEFDTLLDTVAHTPATVCPRRDRDFLHWRYILPNLTGMHPMAVRRRGELVGFAAVEIEGPQAILVDLIASDEEARRAALHLAARYARELGCTHVDYYCTAAGVGRGHLRRLGYAAREERVFQVTLPQGDRQAELLYDANAWHFTEGDKDSPTSFSIEPV